MYLFAICLGRTRSAYSVRPKNRKIKARYWTQVELFSLFFFYFLIFRQPFYISMYTFSTVEPTQQKWGKPGAALWSQRLTLSAQHHQQRCRRGWDGREQLQHCSGCSTSHPLWFAPMSPPVAPERWQPCTECPSPPKHEAALRSAPTPLGRSPFPAPRLSHLPPSCSPCTPSFPLHCLSLSFTLLPQLVKITLEFCFSVKWIWTW